MNPCEEMRQWYLEIFQSPEKLAKFYQKHVCEDWMSGAFLRGICISTVASNIFMAKYNNFSPIETLDPDEKLDMKKFAHEMFPGENAEFKLRAVKVIHTFGNLLN